MSNSPTERAELAMRNTDREIWREREGDFYADSIHVTEGGGIGINCGGSVIVMPLRKWFEAANSLSRAQAEIAGLREAMKPFAEWADSFSDQPPEMSVINYRSVYNPDTRVLITIGDLRNARTALRSETGGLVMKVVEAAKVQSGFHNKALKDVGVDGCDCNLCNALSALNSSRQMMGKEDQS